MYDRCNYQYVRVCMYVYVYVYLYMCAYLQSDRRGWVAMETGSWL